MIPVYLVHPFATCDLNTLNFHEGCLLTLRAVSCGKPSLCRFVGMQRKHWPLRVQSNRLECGTTCIRSLPVVPHKAVAEVSE